MPPMIRSRKVVLSVVERCYPTYHVLTINFFQGKKRQIHYENNHKQSINTWVWMIQAVYLFTDLIAYLLTVSKITHFPDYPEVGFVKKYIYYKGPFVSEREMEEIIEKEVIKIAKESLKDILLQHQGHSEKQVVRPSL